MKSEWMKGLLVAWCFASTGMAQQRPNIVIIMGDDVGYGDVGAYGCKMIPTPHIDQLAAEGIRFTDGHASSSTCSPSRFSMLTGEYAFRHNVGILSPVSPLCIPTDLFTLPKMLQQVGYTTAAIGKWHLGIGAGEKTDWNGEVKPGPMEIGFDRSFILPVTNDRVPCVYLDGHRVRNLDPKDPIYISSRNPVKKTSETAGSTEYPDGKKTPEALTYYTGATGHSCSVINGIGRIGYMVGGKSALWNDEDIADDLMAEAKKFIAENKAKPFFLYFATQDIHVPRAPNKRFQGKTKLSYRGDAMVQLDWSTGEILKTLKENGLADNTIVIFTSDNGPTYNDGYDDGCTVKVRTTDIDRGHDGSGIYKGGKYQIFEGGTRVPFIIRWPGKNQPGTVSDALVCQVDLMASFAKMLGVALDKGVAADSHDTLDAFLGNSKKGLSYLVEHSQGELALRRDEWKYIPGGKTKEMLFNLKVDPGEADNLIGKYPELTESMVKQLEAIADTKSDSKKKKRK